MGGEWHADSAGGSWTMRCDKCRVVSEGRGPLPTTCPVCGKNGLGTDRLVVTGVDRDRRVITLRGAGKGPE